MTRELQHNLKEMVHPTINKIKGVIGLSKLVVNVTGRPGFIWVRLADNLNETVKAHNSKVSPAYGMPVEMTFDGKKYEIIGRDVDRYSEWNTNAAFLGPHGGQHSAMRDAAGDDIVWVDPQQFLPLLIVPNGATGTTGVQEVPYIYRNTQGNWGYPGASGITIPVGTNPTGSRMFLLMLKDNDDTFYGITGSYFSISTSGTANIVAQIPTFPATSNDKPLSAIRMDGTDPKVKWENIYDARQWLTNNSPVPTGTPSYLLNLPIYNTGTFVGNATSLDFYNSAVSMNGNAAIITPGSTGGGDGGIINTSEESISGSYTLVDNSGVWADSGLLITLPAAGTYNITCNIRWGFKGNAGSTWYLLAKLYNATDAADIVNSTQMLFLVNLNTLDFQGTTMLQRIISVNASKTIKLYVSRVGTSFVSSYIFSDTAGYTTISYVKLE